ncbi:MAG: VanZ family protein [Eubacterium sp.]
MKKIIHTLFINFRYFFLHYFCPPLLIALIIFGIVLFIKYKKEKANNFFVISVNKKTLNSFVFIFYIVFIFQSTVFDRLITNQRHEPLSNVFGGWTIVETQYFYDLSVIWNIIMFLPVAIFVFLYFHLYGKKFNHFKLFLNSTIIALVNSVLIETMQLIFHVGTFQISDLVYNTLGGFLGSLIFVLAVKIRDKKRRKPND